MAGPEHLAARLQRFPIERLRLAVAALGVVEKGQVVEAGQRVRMAEPEHLAPRLQRFPIERLRLAVAALGVVETGQVVEAGQGSRVAVAKRLSRQPERLFGELCAVRIVARL